MSRGESRLVLRRRRKKMAPAISPRTTTAATMPPAIAPVGALEDVEANAVTVGDDSEAEVREADIDSDDTEEAVESVYVYCT